MTGHLRGRATLKIFSLILTRSRPNVSKIAVFLQKLNSRGIQFQSFCQLGQKIMMAPSIQTEEKPRADVFRKEFENLPHAVPKPPNLLRDVTQLFKSIPPVNVLLCGIHVGILTSALVTHICMRKTKKNSIGEVRERTVAITIGSDQSTFALVPLNTPPGTPPSLVHPRMFLDFLATVLECCVAFTISF